MLFIVVLYLVRAVHKFDFTLFIKETLNKCRPVGKGSYNERDSRFGQDLYGFRRPST